nr:PREDICTED: uncharacterized protein LOC109041873 [Bemisia tabaci]XP_018913919.1 PREDICTED: uncharacterized protein LOC109041873 [Bemisia tabaci]
MRLQNLTLSAKRNDDNTDLTDRTAKDLEKLRSLVELNLDHYKLKDIHFIRPLDKLEVLRLHNIALSKKIEPAVSQRATLQDKKYIKILSLDDSPDLVELIRPFFVCFPNLRTISLQRTGLKTLRADDFALNVVHTLRLDISYNPLACDADLDWICSETNNSGSNFTLLEAENTYCTKPHLIRLTKFQAQNAQVMNRATPRPGFKDKYLTDVNIVTASDIIFVCLTLLPVAMFILHLIASHRNRQRSMSTVYLRQNSGDRYLN